MSSIEEIGEMACGQAVSAVLGHVASVTKIPASHLALEVPGSCHTHSPTTCVVDGCAYCARNGNCFAVHTQQDSKDPVNEDLVAEAVADVRTTLKALVERVLNRLDSRGIDTRKTRDEFAAYDLEAMLLSELAE